MHLENFIYQHFRMNDIDNLFRQRFILPVQVEVLLSLPVLCIEGLLPQNYLFVLLSQTLLLSL